MNKKDGFTFEDINRIRMRGFEQGYLSAKLGKDYIFEDNQKECKRLTSEADEILKYQDQKLDEYLK